MSGVQVIAEVGSIEARQLGDVGGDAPGLVVGEQLWPALGAPSASLCGAHGV